MVLSLVVERVSKCAVAQEKAIEGDSSQTAATFLKTRPFGSFPSPHGREWLAPNSKRASRWPLAVEDGCALTSLATPPAPLRLRTGPHRSDNACLPSSDQLVPDTSREDLRSPRTCPAKCSPCRDVITPSAGNDRHFIIVTYRNASRETSV